MQRSVTCNTKVDKGAVASKSVITYDYTGVKMEDLIPGWEDGATIKLQAKWRRDEVIPAKVTVKVIDMCQGRAPQVITPEVIGEMAPLFTKEQRDQLLAKLLALKDLDKKAA